MRSTLRDRWPRRSRRITRSLCSEILRGLSRRMRPLHCRVRIALALGEKNTLVTRFQYEVNDQSNVGVGGLVLPSAGYNSSTSETTLQVSDTQILSPRVIN